MYRLAIKRETRQSLINKEGNSRTRKKRTIWWVYKIIPARKTEYSYKNNKPNECRKQLRRLFAK